VIAVLWPRLLAAGVRWCPGMLALTSDGHRGMFRWRIQRVVGPESLEALETETGILFRWVRDDGWRVSAMVVAAITTGSARGLVDSAWEPLPITLHRYIGSDAVPDLTDPATLGALLGELRRLTGDPYALVEHPGNYWQCTYRVGPRHTIRHWSPATPTEGEALLDALAQVCGVST
jgi:hypothetical protein